MSKVNYKPEHCNTINTYLFVDDGKAAVEFYVKAFDGVLGDLMEGPDGSIMHASVRIGDSALMLSQANPQRGTQSPQSLGGSPAMIHLYVTDADASFAKAIDCGCKEVAPLMDCFWGERMGKVEDPFGFQWGISTQTEVLTAEEVQRRGAEWMEQMANGGHSS
jgi:PhnB protein